MFQKDPLKHVEDLTKEVHDVTGRYTQPVLSRYPLLFSFLVVFSLAAILHGFELFTDQFGIFRQHPIVLISIGIVGLLVTGSLYKSLR